MSSRHCAARRGAAQRGGASFITDARALHRNTCPPLSLARARAAGAPSGRRARPGGRPAARHRALWPHRPPSGRENGLLFAELAAPNGRGARGRAAPPVALPMLRSQRCCPPACAPARCECRAASVRAVPLPPASRSSPPCGKHAPPLLALKHPSKHPIPLSPYPLAAAPSPPAPPSPWVETEQRPCGWKLSNDPVGASLKKPLQQHAAAVRAARGRRPATPGAPPQPSYVALLWSPCLRARSLHVCAAAVPRAPSHCAPSHCENLGLAPVMQVPRACMRLTRPRPRPAAPVDGRTAPRGPRAGLARAAVTCRGFAGAIHPTTEAPSAIALAVLGSCGCTGAGGQDGTAVCESTGSNPTFGPVHVLARPDTGSRGEAVAGSPGRATGVECAVRKLR
jgi:hypothetical protein